MTSLLPQRTFLLLAQADADRQLVRQILKRPLTLATEIVRCLFENDFQALYAALDNILRPLPLG
jgi:hypothetical protein